MLRQATEALNEDRLDEAYQLATHPDAQGDRRTWKVQKQVQRALLARAERHLRLENIPQSWSDLLWAESLGSAEPSVVRLRQTLTSLGMAEVRALVEAGHPNRALEAIAALRDRNVRSPDLRPLEEACRAWLLAGELADRGEFVLAIISLDRVRQLATVPMAAVDHYRHQLHQRHERARDVSVQLLDAANREHWRDVVRLADELLSVAPQHAEARTLRNRAWHALEPETRTYSGHAQANHDLGATVARSQLYHANSIGGSHRPTRYMLWIDGVGGYLICLSKRITIGHANSDPALDLPILADLSSLHASLTRDEEGYILKAERATAVNGKPVEQSVLLQAGDRLTLGSSCQLLFQLPVPLSMSARIELVSGHRLPLSADAVLLMADSLIIGAGPKTHICMPRLSSSLILFRHHDEIGVKFAGEFRVEGHVHHDRTILPARANIVSESFSMAIEPVSSHLRA
jgi:hypothetical protein